MIRLQLLNLDHVVRGFGFELVYAVDHFVSKLVEWDCMWLVLSLERYRLAGITGFA
jgi:hypothetical protein